MAGPRVVVRRCAPFCRDKAWDRHSCSRRWRKPIRLGYRRTSEPAASGALYERLGFLHTGVSELPEGGPPVWPMRRPPAELMSVATIEEIGAQASLRNTGAAQSDLLWTRDVAEVISIPGRPERVVTGSDDQQLRS